MTSFLPPKPVPVENLGLRSDRIEWMGVSAERFQKQEVERAGLSWGDSSDVITTSPGALVTAEALRAFRRASDGVSGPVEGVVVGDMAGWSQEPCFGPPAKLYRGGVGYGGKRTDALVEFEVPGRTISFSSADRPGGRTLELQISDGVLIPRITGVGCCGPIYSVCPPYCGGNSSVRVSRCCGKSHGLG